MIDTVLNKSYSSTSYQLGRYFAVCEKLQKDVTNSKTSTISSYYEGLMRNPKQIYTKINHLSRIYLSKTKSIFYDKLLSEIGSKIADIPKKMDLDMKAEFILGYYQQKQDLYTSHKYENQIQEVKE